LADLISADDQGGIKNFFANQEQLNIPDAQGSYPLHRAVEKGSAKTVQLLLALGAKSEVQDANGRSPFRLAIDSGSIDCVKILAAAGADLFSADGSGATAIQAALSKGGEVLSAALTQKNVNLRGPDGSTALHLASDKLLEDQVSRLLAAGADPSQRDGQGRTPLDLALLHPDRIEAARVAEALVLKGGSTSFPDFAWFTQAARTLDYGSLRYEDGGTPLHQAVAHKEKGFVEFLLAKKVNPNVRNGAGSAPLHEAVRSGWLEGLELLLKGGADPNVRDGFDNSPLHIALPEESRSGGVPLLLKYGADPSLKDRNGNTPLHVAIQVGYPIDMIKDLLAAKAPVNAQNAAGDAPLHVALRAKRYDYAKVLLDAGADIFLVNGKGESPLSVAILLGPDALDGILSPVNVRARDNFGNAPLAIAVALKASPDAIAMIVAKGADINDRNNAGDAALHLAVRQGLRAQGEALLLAKADIFNANVKGDSPLTLALTASGGPVDWFFTPATIAARDTNGDTPLHHAAKRDLAQALEFLVQKGSVLEAANASGETALHQAVKADAAEAASSLIALGASLSARDAMGDTPLHSSVLWQARRSLPLLVLAGADLNARDYAGEAPIHQAVRKRDRDSLKFLLSKGADADARDNRGSVPLALAVKSSAPDLERDLLAAQAEADARDQAGRTPLIEAASMGDADSSSILVASGANIMAKDGDGDSALTISISGAPALLKILLTKDNINKSDAEGKTPLRCIVEALAVGKAAAPAPASGAASASGAVPAAPVLDSLDLAIATGARLDERDRFSATCLHAALRAGDKDTAARLAKAGADVFAKDKDGVTPASLAIAAGVDALKSLVNAAGIAVKDKQGNGWLHYAAIAASADAVNCLIAAGADRTARNISGETAYDIAIKRGQQSLAALLKVGN
jgi:ankyrin repeat protein